MLTTSLSAPAAEVKRPTILAIDVLAATDPEPVNWDPARCKLAVAAVIPIVDGQVRMDLRYTYTERYLPELRRRLQQADIVICWNAEFDIGLIFGGRPPRNLRVIDLFQVVSDLAGYRVPLWVATRDTLGRRLAWSRDAHELWAAGRFRDVGRIAIDHARAVAELVAMAEAGEPIMADGRGWQWEPGEFLGLGAADEATAIA